MEPQGPRIKPLWAQWSVQVVQVVVNNKLISSYILKRTHCINFFFNSRRHSLLSCQQIQSTQETGLQYYFLLGLVVFAPPSGNILLSLLTREPVLIPVLGFSIGYSFNWAA